MGASSTADTKKWASPGAVAEEVGDWVCCCCMPKKQETGGGKGF